MTLRLGSLLLVAALASACSGGNVCSNNVDLTAKAGTCTGVAMGRALGEPSTCSMRSSSCDGTEGKTISTAMECLSKLPTCDPASQTDWVSQQRSCTSALSGLSQGCKTALFGGVLPGEDGGIDAGPYVDAGRQPIEDGGHGISLVAIADEKSFAFAWVPLQPAGINTWELNVFDAADADGGGMRLPEIVIPGGTTRTFQLIDAGPGVHRRFYIAGLDSMGQQAIGFIEDAGAPMVIDGGCTNHYQCPTTDVCDMNFCRPQTCMMSSTCPQPDYICNVSIMPSMCFRTGNAGAPDGGLMMMTGPTGQRTMISPSVSVTTGPQTFKETFIGGFSGHRPDMVAIDSARQFVVMEQGGAPVGHFTVSRGKDFVLDTQSAAVIDTVGSNVRVAYNPDNQVLYACYSVGRGVRVKRSRDFGKTWGAGALTLEPEDDGGTSSTISDCDIAAWKNGTALLVTVDDQTIVTRQINEILGVNGTPDIAFVPSPSDGGGYNVFDPRRPAIATDTTADIVHIGFTGRRILGGVTDTDIYGVYRDPTSGGVFSNPLFINAPGGTGGSSSPQDYVSVTIDPVTRRGVAAWTAIENTGGGNYTTVYLGFFNNSTKRWITGSDLSVFMSLGLASYPLFPLRTTGLWDAFAPQVGVMRDGRVWLMVLAGERSSGGVNDIFPYSVEFAFDAGSPVGGTGWFKPPAQKMSNTKAVDPRAGGNSVPATNAAFAVDSQISIYGTVIEAVGAMNQEENRGVFISRP